ncbi:DUF4256 domain-containing protein [Sphingobacterium paucimobilis]|uniref:DUF4256 domain-containing protein n=1 Tax=Sphingobacterium paucimobilis HER1398 TaxID=1346330 RepID=U2HS25_9SPHI|nr:DUF4256 domain-containing protein [Sphingobacterium paucimobilis]ERJ58050.1 hypothetical protein M472_04660 [Sphingobacterium paucimobilis HER1398]
MKSNTLSAEQIRELAATLKERFEKNRNRHASLRWEEVWNKVSSDPHKITSLYHMEQTEGQPDVIGYDEKKSEYLFCDCAPESPKGRRSVCYDHQALESRKEHKPKHSATAMAAEMGIALLTEAEYQQLQQLGEFDLKTSSWLHTPEDIRSRGGAIFGDKRFGRTFIYHNGAESYYAARGFRGILRV